MGNIKVRVSNEIESKEVQKLLESLGFNCGITVLSQYIYAKSENMEAYTMVIDPNNYKELTIPQLRDLVVLNRNDVKDATHTCNGHKYYLTGSEFYEYINEHWENVDEWVDGCSFKPIEKKEMKEFLVNHDNKWTLQLLDADTEENSFRVSVPSGADTATRDSSDIIYFWKNASNETYVDGEGWKLCDDKEYTFLNTYIQHDDAVIVWQRHTQPEELPFVDDEPKPCTRSMRSTGGHPYQEQKDNVNHPNHYTQGGIECIDALESATIVKRGIEAVCTANIIKYLWRYEEKNGLEDVKKAQWYLNRLIKHLEK